MCPTPLALPWICWAYFIPVFTGIEPGTFGSKGQRVIHSAMSAEGARRKKIYDTILLSKETFLFVLKALNSTHLTIHM